VEDIALTFLGFFLTALCERDVMCLTACLATPLVEVLLSRHPMACQCENHLSLVFFTALRRPGSLSQSSPLVPLNFSVFPKGGTFPAFSFFSNEGPKIFSLFPVLCPILPSLFSLYRTPPQCPLKPPFPVFFYLMPPGSSRPVSLPPLQLGPTKYGNEL